VGFRCSGKDRLPFGGGRGLLLWAIIGAVALSRRHLVIGAGRDETTEDAP